MANTTVRFDQPTEKRHKRKRPGTVLRIKRNMARICKFDSMKLHQRQRVLTLIGFSEQQVATMARGIGDVDLLVEADKCLLEAIEDRLADDPPDETANRRQIGVRRKPIEWEAVARQSLAFGEHLDCSQDQLRDCLSDYECANVVNDEVRRSVDLLENLDRNRQYFTHEIRGVTSFLPLNQPIYSTICFGVVPSMMCDDVTVRPPTVMQATCRRLFQCLRLEHFFPTLRVSYELDKEKFCRERAPVTETVIFTGTPQNGEKVRRKFRPECLFILNGSGHNPLVITETANLNRAIESTLRVVLYNQGQDCAGPNAILVHRDCHSEFLRRLTHELTAIENRCGPCLDPNNIVGPNTDIEATVEVASRLATVAKEHPGAVVYGGSINAANRVIMPTVIDMQLRHNSMATETGLREWFAPIFFIQRYETDAQLQWYFEHPSYQENAMYVSVFGKSAYVRSLNKKGLHTSENILMNADLHQVERGFLPYGGLGMAASHVSFCGKKRAGATLPQREMHTYLVENKPLM